MDGSLEVIKYHGHRREVRPAKLADTDIILTTYHTLAADVASKKNTLHQIRWYRVVLDEGEQITPERPLGQYNRTKTSQAHIVRRQSTKLYAAVALLAAELRWCLTATPIHNSLEDIGSLIALVGVFPLDNPLLFRKHIVLPFERDEHTVRDKLQRILDSLCLRRKASLLDLPELVEIRRELCLTAKEKQQYERTSSLMDLAIKQRANDASGKLNPFGLFQAQLQLRILCNHGTFQKQFSWGQARDFLLEREDAVALLGQNSEIKCSLCKEIIPILSITRPLTDLQHCGHIFCPECVLQQPGPRCGNGFLTQCQLCQKADIESARSDGNKPRSFTSKTAFAQQDDNYFNDNGFSTKIAAIMADLEEDQFKSKRSAINNSYGNTNIDIKPHSIIFSCWTRTLNLISRHLRCRGVHFSRIDGNCELNRRQEMIRSFSTENDVPVLIMTTGTGAFGYKRTFHC